MRSFSLYIFYKKRGLQALKSPLWLRIQAVPSFALRMLRQSDVFAPIALYRSYAGMTRGPASAQSRLNNPLWASEQRMPFRAGACLF